MNFYQEFFLNKKIVIFGMGRNGIKLQQELASIDIKVDYFSDNNKEKIGTIAEGVRCISLEDLAAFKNDIIVIVSPERPEAITKQLKDLGFKNIYENHMFCMIPKTKFADSLEYMVPFGHYYSLYPDVNEIREKEKEIFQSDKVIKDIDFNEKEQVEMLKLMGEMYKSIPDWLNVHENKETPYRYRWGNDSLNWGDAIALHCMLRIVKPKKMIEVGSGYTSAITLDTNEFYLGNSINLTFIEPYADRLKNLLKKSDEITLIEKGLQDIPLNTFATLDEGDILFIDSTHVSKINSDVNYLFFEILPMLKKGVIIHLHDIFYPFEYPKQWILKGRIWNELYLLRAFLQNNNNYKIIFFQNMMEEKYMDVFLENWQFDKPVMGGSIWIEKIK